jgi:hypothetical protein
MNTMPPPFVGIYPSTAALLPSVGLPKSPLLPPLRFLSSPLSQRRAPADCAAGLGEGRGIWCRGGEGGD